MTPLPRIALVTGASRRQGIGAAICRALARDGVEVAFSHWGAYDAGPGAGADDDGPKALSAEIAAMGVRCRGFDCDLSDPAAPARLLADVETAMGPISILVNNAAYSTRDGYERLDASTLDAHYAVNIRATALLSVGFARRWQGDERGSGGRIINLSSGQGRGPMPEELAYAASKGAIEALTVSLAAEVAPLGITVNAVNPGPTDSGWMTDDIKRELQPRFPFGRIGVPDDVARLIVFLASEKGAWITGQILHSEGGFLR